MSGQTKMGERMAFKTTSISIYLKKYAHNLMIEETIEES